MFRSLVAKLAWRRRLREFAKTRSASVYRVGDRVVICPQLLTKAGYQISGPPAALDWPIGSEALAAAIEAAFAASGRIVPTPRRDDHDFSPVIAAAGVNSHKAFMANARLVDVTLEDGTLRLLPMINHGVRRGFEGVGEETGHVFYAGQLAAAATRLLDMLGDKLADEHRG